MDQSNASNRKLAGGLERQEEGAQNFTLEIRIKGIYCIFIVS